MAPAMTKAQKTVRGALIPAISAASGFDPTARKRRAGRRKVRARPMTRQAASASTTVTRMSRPRTVTALAEGSSTSQGAGWRW